MDKFIASSDGQKIHYQVSGHGPATLVFVHGWLGNGEWWNHQQSHFSSQYTVIQIDLAGHGRSEKSRKVWSAAQYAEDIKAVVSQLDSQNVILVGHSMSGAYAVMAAIGSPDIKAVILIDTLKDLDQIFTSEQAEEMMFKNYRKDFRHTIENVMPKFLFSQATPETAKKRLLNEFLQTTPELAIKLLEPLYKIDVREYTKKLTVPVRAINSDYTPTNSEVNRKYFKDYDWVIIKDCGHYPMLERPEEFNQLLNDTLSKLAPAAN